MSTPSDIDTAASKVTVLPVDAAQTAANLAASTRAIVNNNYATAANLGPTSVLFADDPDSDASKPYINTFVARAADKDNPTYLKLAALYHDPEVEAAVPPGPGRRRRSSRPTTRPTCRRPRRIEDDSRATGS